MNYNNNTGIAEINGVEFRVRGVLLQHSLWKNTEEFFRQAEQTFVQRYNTTHGTNKAVLPVSFMYAISKGGHRIRTSTLLEILGYDGIKISPSEPDYKFLLNEILLKYTNSNPEECFVQSFALPESGVLSTINFLILPCRDFFVGIVSMEE